MARHKNHAWIQTNIGFIQLSQHLSVSHQAFIQFVHADREGHAGQCFLGLSSCFSLGYHRVQCLNLNYISTSTYCLECSSNCTALLDYANEAQIHFRPLLLSRKISLTYLNICQSLLATITSQHITFISHCLIHIKNMTIITITYPILTTAALLPQFMHVPTAYVP